MIISGELNVCVCCLSLCRPPLAMGLSPRYHHGMFTTTMDPPTKFEADDGKPYDHSIETFTSHAKLEVPFDARSLFRQIPAGDAKRFVADLVGGSVRNDVLLFVETEEWF